LWIGEEFTGSTHVSPYYGTSAESRYAMLREYQLKFYGVK